MTIKKQPKKKVTIMIFYANNVGNKTTLYGLGSDNKVYWWDRSLTEWALLI